MIEATYKTNPAWACAKCSTVTTATTSAATTSPSATTATDGDRQSLTAIQININGIGNKITELQILANREKPHLILIQETKLRARSTTPQLQGYTSARCDRPNGDGGGGLLIYMATGLKHEPISATAAGDINFEHQHVRIPHNGDHLNVYNIYAPPGTSDDLTNGLNNINPGPNTTLVCGDYNSHSGLWHSALAEDPRGRIMAEWLEEHDQVVLNTETPTRAPIANPTQRSSPDITSTSADIALDTSWEVITRLSSDHLPIKLTIESIENPAGADSNLKSRWNFRLAKWPKFTEEVDSHLGDRECPTEVTTACSELVKAIHKSSKNNIPCGRQKKTTPRLPADIRKLVDDRDRLRGRLGSQASPEEARELSSRTERLLNAIRDYRRERWKEFTTKLAEQPGKVKDLWRTLKVLSGKTLPPTSIAIQVNGQPTKTRRAAAVALNCHFTSMTGRVKNRATRKTIRAGRKMANDHHRYTITDLLGVVTKLKLSPAMGPDGLTNLHLRHLGPTALNWLLRIFNNSIDTGCIPTAWKGANIIPIPKMGKDPADAASYRPISLLSPIAKCLERLILPTLRDAIELPSFQHGFRSDHSTTTALMHIINDAADGLNQKKPPVRTVIAALDLRAAFDLVNIDRLLNKIYELTIPTSIKHWLGAYLRGRSCRTIYEGARSHSKMMHTGVPQGGGTQPTTVQPVYRRPPRACGTGLRDTVRRRHHGLRSRQERQHRGQPSTGLHRHNYELPAQHRPETLANEMRCHAHHLMGR